MNLLDREKSERRVFIKNLSPGSSQKGIKNRFAGREAVKSGGKSWKE